MRLSRVHITSFQSIRDSGPFTINDITCLVGKNESGKTAVLKALYRLNPIIRNDGVYDVTDDYPRADVEDYQQDVESGICEPATVVVADFELSQDEVKIIEEDLGEGVLKKATLTLSKGYNNKFCADLEVNEKIALEKMVDKAQLPTQLATELLNILTIKELNTQIENMDDPENTDHIERLKAIIRPIQDNLVNYIFSQYLEESVPKFLYFDEYFTMRGHENIEALKTRSINKKLLPSDHPLLGLIKLARIDLDDLLNPSRTEWLINRLEGAGNHLSKKILKYWSQNKHLQMKFDVRPARPGDPVGMTSGTNIWTRVYDTKRMVTTPLGTRSRGFVWFFSFLAWFNQQQRNNEQFILLLDEPGLFLHGKAQGDLLKYIEEELKTNHQVIYTTHSPFMVDANNFDRVRIIQDKSTDSDEQLPVEEDGTKVITDVLEATEDSLFPLQGALGYDISQTLFVGPNCLIVEGVSDLLYIQTISAVLGSLKRESLSEKWTITPVGGSDKVPTFVALLGAQKGLKIATLIDFQTKDRQTIENLYKKKLLKKQNVLTFADFNKTPEADIEDMFGVDFYMRLINGEYYSHIQSPISVIDLTSKKPRILQKLEDYFSDKPLKDNIKFNHFRPARYFVENISKFESDIPAETLDRFEKIFNTLNSIL